MIRITPLIALAVPLLLLIGAGANALNDTQNNNQNSAMTGREILERVEDNQRAISDSAFNRI
jgi:hypothetical protein